MLGLYKSVRVVHGTNRLEIRRDGFLSRNFLGSFEFTKWFRGGWLNGVRIGEGTAWYDDRGNYLRFQRALHPGLDDFPVAKFEGVTLEVIEVPLSAPFSAHFIHKNGLADVQIFAQLRSWSFPWTYQSFFEASRDDYKVTRQGQTRLGFGMRASADTTLHAHFRACIAHAEELVKAGLQQCRDTLDQESLVTYFDFPEETKSACQQYLAYFTQFLRDLGIESEAQIKEEANRILFTVSPMEGRAALERVREALSAYLQLPALADHQRNATLGTDIAGLQADAQVSHFKAQLMLAAATLQAQRQTISAQEATILALQAPMQKGAPTSPAAPTGPDKEPIFRDIVYVKDYDGKGFSIALAKIARKLKRRPPAGP